MGTGCRAETCSGQRMVNASGGIGVAVGVGEGVGVGDGVSVGVGIEVGTGVGTGVAGTQVVSSARRMHNWSLEVGRWSLEIADCNLFEIRSLCNITL